MGVLRFEVEEESTAVGFYDIGKGRFYKLEPGENGLKLYKSLWALGADVVPVAIFELEGKENEE